MSLLIFLWLLKSIHPNDHVNYETSGSLKEQGKNKVGEKIFLALVRSNTQLLTKDLSIDCCISWEQLKMNYSFQIPEN